MEDESHWIERAQTAEAQLKTVKDQYVPAIERIQIFKTNFGVREKSDGSIVIDFDKFTANLGMEQALELRLIIDEKYGITGAAGDKPRISLPGSAAA